ncbi:hypothetical protein VTL71DRAFT_9010 [Oculimacula yallundae]|uniref:Uncharacterized protein n=1 Tax=Oculimacula yallundae TaxID=86028 RepID=A0ABR4BTH9_9HELO
MEPGFAQDFLKMLASSTYNCEADGKFKWTERIPWSVLGRFGAEMSKLGYINESETRSVDICLLSNKRTERTPQSAETPWPDQRFILTVVDE